MFMLSSFDLKSRVKKVAEEPVSTFSNIAYPIAGVTAAYVAEGGPVLELMIIITTLSMGLGSALFHARQTHFFQKLDELNMYALLLSVLAFRVGEPWLALAVVVLSAGAGMVHQKLSSTITVGMLGMLNIAVIGWQTGNWYMTALILAVFLMSYGVRQLGETWYNKGEIVPYDMMHGIWHLGTAYVIFLMLIAN